MSNESSNKPLAKKVTNLSKLLKQEGHPEKFYLKIFDKLDGYDMTVEILKDTGIGKLINAFRKKDSAVLVDRSKGLVRKWMKLVQEPPPTAAHSAVSEPRNKRPKIEKPKEVQVYFYQPNKKCRGGNEALPGNSSLAGKCPRGNSWAGLYSGAKATRVLLSLLDLCKRTLSLHVETIYHVGNLDYDVLDTVFSSCTAEQLNLIEHRNAHLQGHGERVWKRLVEREFHSQSLVGDSWKTMYWDKIIERKEKYKRLTNSISAAKYEKERGDPSVRHMAGPPDSGKRAHISGNVGRRNNAIKMSGTSSREGGPRSTAFVNLFKESQKRYRR